MKLTISGYSDDNLAFHGAIDDEIGCYNCGKEETEYIAVSDGTLLSVAYGMDGSGCWRFNLIHKGSAFKNIVPGSDDDDAKSEDPKVSSYSDAVYFEGEIKWLLFKSHYLKARKDDQ